MPGAVAARRQQAQELRARRPYYSRLARPAAGHSLPNLITPQQCSPPQQQQPPQLF